MDPIIHKIVPNGDTLLILRNSNAPFAVMAASSVWPDAIEIYQGEDEMGENEQEMADSVNAEQTTTESRQEVHLWLSSKHLALTSKYFQKMTTNSWKEANSEGDSAYSVTAEDWDVDALLIVMQILHCQTHKVPRVIGVEMVAKVAVIVDYYQCHKAVDFYAKTWMTNFAVRELPLVYGRDLLLRLLISCVFLEAGTFRILTKTIIRQSKGPIHSLGLPFPRNIIDALERRRRKLVSGIISSLQNLADELSVDNRACLFECSSMSLGALIKGAGAMGLLNPSPKSPFEGYSFVTMENAILNFKQPDYSVMQHYSGLVSPWIVKHECYLSERVRPILEEQTIRIRGLELGRFMKMDRET